MENYINIVNGGNVVQPELDFQDVYPEAFGTGDSVVENHDKLLDYLSARLSVGNELRTLRIMRYAVIDRFISTWQVLTEQDTVRKVKEETTGQAQAIASNLPLSHTHIDDMVSFFSQVYAPTAGDFFQMGEPETQQAVKPLIEKLNADAKLCKYYKNLCASLRSLLKYNIGGFAIEWDDDTEANYADTIDMYNFMWDTDIPDPSLISKEAEWAAIVKLKNPRWVATQETKGNIRGAFVALDNSQSMTNGRSATYYRYPPMYAGLTHEDQKSGKGSKNRMDWAAYGAGLSGDSVTQINGHEVIYMYCWLNPKDFGLSYLGNEYPASGYYLWRFTILNMKRIVAAKPVNEATFDEATDDSVIPYYVGYLNQDDTGDAQRSVGELLRPFQSFASFLVNTHVAGTRSNIWGIQGYDPSMFDMGQVKDGDTVARIPSKIPGRDVRSGLLSLNGTVDTSGTMETLTGVMGLMKEFFPAQALPSQIASIDRAVNSQVSAVMQGVNRRLHMYVRVLDDDILGPSRMKMVENIVGNQAVQVTDVTDDQIRRVIGNGLSQLNREAAAAALQQLIYVLIQNPESGAQIDILSLINYWSGLLNIQADMTDFLKPTPQPTPGQQPPTPQATPAQTGGQ